MAGFPAYAQGSAAARAAAAQPTPPAQPAAASTTVPPATPAQPAAVADARTILSINVSGSQRIEPDTVRSYIKLRPGMTYTKASLDQALRDLFDTELFEDVQIRDDNGALTIEVKENPVINRVLFEGNKRLKEDKFKDEIKLAPRQIFSPSKVRADVARIIELYRRQGRYGASVSPKKVLLDQNRVDVIYEISEGPKSKVRAINIIGNHVFSDKLLRAQMATKISSLKHFLSSSTTYDADRMAYDQQKLRQFYLTEGYADFKVVSATAELTPDRKDFVITYVVEEGPRYKYGDVSVESDLHDLKPDLFKPVVTVKKGDWFNAKADEDIIDNMTKRAGFFGYAFADVNVDVHPHLDTRTMDVIFKVSETPRVYVERINITGNTLTQDKVIRREFRLNEGDAFNEALVKRSEDRIKSLGYFQEKFEIEQKKGSADDRVILGANVEDKATGQLQLSAGYSDLEKLTFSASIAQRNFRGAGQTLQLSGSISAYSRSVDLGFSEPYAFDKNIAVGFDIFTRAVNSFNFIGTSRNTTYSTTSTGFQLRAGLPLTEFWSLALRYGWRTENVTLDPSTYYLPDANGVPQCSVLLAGRYLCDAIGHRTISDFGYSLVRSTLDNALHPGHGMRLVISQDLAGPGGNVRYIKSTFDGAKYFTLHKGFIFSAKLEGGAIIPLKGGPAGQDPVQLSDRFFLGEPNFAGFDIQGVGPKVLRNYLGVSPATAAQFVGDAYELYDGQKTPLSVLAGA
ncbi:MAG: outer membrane protein assembly factor BamA, partial [Alphaproteobacteria bacterium]|nr:outer membrane protein assembly factor BamA [Alphaproteobacteria bacterium]